MNHLIRSSRRAGLAVLVALLTLLTSNLAVAAPNENAAGAMPRLILTAFQATPAEPVAGEEATLSFTVKNMSTSTGVRNIKASVTSADGSLLPVGGASSVYIASIPAGGAVSYDLRFQALPTLEEPPYQLSVHTDYEESAGGTALSSDETVSVSVKQHARAETSELQVQPASITVGQDANLSFSVLNKGKNKLYNTSVALKAGQPVTAPEQFIGTIEPGAAGAVDVVLHADTASSAPVTLVISYEDAVGTVSSFERQVELTITEPVTPAPQVEENQGSTAVGWLFLVLPLLVIAGIVVLIVLAVRRRRRRNATKDDEETLVALDSEPLLPEDGV